MKSLTVNEKKRRAKLYVYEEKKKVLRCLKHNRRLNLGWWSRYKLSTLSKKIINTRCIITGRGRGVNRSFKFSRLELPRWIRLKRLPGVEVSSW
jgi:ribosomal protein S14